MDCPFSSKEKGFAYWGSPRAQMEGLAQYDGAMRNLSSEDPFSISELMNFDTYTGWCNSPAVTDQMFASFGLLSPQSMPQASIDPLNITEQNSAAFAEGGGALSGIASPYSCGDRMVFQQTDTDFGSLLDNRDANDSSVTQNLNNYQQSSIPDFANCMISRPIGRPSLDEKMLRALSLFKESSGGGILAQVWTPIKQGDQLILTTSEQPYLLDQMLSGYREISRAYTFSAEVKPGSFPGLPGRVFMSRVPEWTSNVSYYKQAEYLRVVHAINHNVQGCIALPVFEPTDMACCAVLELVTVKEKPNFDSEIENVCHALQAVNLRTSAPPRITPQCLSRNQKAALSEISDVLRAVCHSHRLPLALTWIPCSLTEGAICVKDGQKVSDGKCVLCIQDTACYVNEKEMQRFVHACAEHYLEEGQGIAGKALQSNHPFFVSDVKTCDISEYPLVHHARRFGLNAAVAIRLRSTYTGDDDYILEFFLPLSMKGNSEQQLLLNNLSGTMQRICKTLRTVSEAELDGRQVSKIELQNGKNSNFPPLSRRNFETSSSPDGDSNSSERNPLKVSNAKKGTESDGTSEQVMTELKRQPEKRKHTSEKNVSLSVLQQYFSGSLKDAAKSIGVCPTTLKRICRQHGISRWPSRKINKVNRSLKKIQTVLHSVQGVEGGLKFDPVTGEFVAAGSIIQEFDGQRTLLVDEKNLPARNPERVSQETPSATPSSSSGIEKSVVKLEEDECALGENSGGASRNVLISNSYPAELKILTLHSADCSQDPKLGAADAGQFKPSWAFPENSQSSSSLAAACEMDTRMEGDDEIVDHNHRTCSSITDSSNSSGSMLHGSSSSSKCFEERNCSEIKSSCVGSGSKITVKATYKEDTVRFKFEPSAGCLQLHEEVAKRFKLQYGTFQLKYLDDEEEWVLLVNDSDLQECLEILDGMGMHNVKFLVLPIPSSMGSSGSSTCFLAGST
ncbi:hypothetical protein SLA2020_093970 [Shorea laevis]